MVFLEWQRARQLTNSDVSNKGNARSVSCVYMFRWMTDFQLARNHTHSCTPLTRGEV